MNVMSCVQVLNDSKGLLGGGIEVELYKWGSAPRKSLTKFLEVKT